jgi:hypothetical protein
MPLPLTLTILKDTGSPTQAIFHFVQRISVSTHIVYWPSCPAPARIEMNPSITGISAVFARRLAVEWGGTVIAKSCCEAVASRAVRRLKVFEIRRRGTKVGPLFDEIGNRAVVGAEGARSRRGERGRVPYFRF